MCTQLLKQKKCGIVNHKLRLNNQQRMTITTQAGLPEWSKGVDLRPTALSARGFKPHSLQKNKFIFKT